MKKIALTIVSAIALAAGAAFADGVKANRTTQSFAEFVDASGCKIVDMGGYSNLTAKDGGNCPFSVTQAFVGNYSVITPGADGILGTSDDGQRSDN